MRELTSHVDALRHLTRTEPDPRVRHRADALVVRAQGRPPKLTAQAREAVETALAASPLD